MIKKIKKNQKKIIYKIEKRQRSDWMLQKGWWSFYCSAVFRGLLRLKISNIGTARTCRVYIRVLIAYNMRAISMEDAFWRFWRIISAFLRLNGILHHLNKNKRLKRVFRARLGGALILISLRTFLF